MKKLLKRITPSLLKGKLTKLNSKISYIIPKNQNRIVFYPLHEKDLFSGNLKYIYQYLITQNLPYKFVWITNNSKTSKEIQKIGGISSTNKIKNLFYILSSKYILTDTQYTIENNFPPLAYGKFNIIQTWHGTGFKEIGFRVKNHHYTKTEQRKLPKQTKFIIATSPCDKERKSKSFLTDKVYVTGSPRNDILLKKDATSNLRNKIDPLRHSEIILYAPTFRDKKPDYNKNAISRSFWDKLSSWMKTKNIIMLIKRHPADKRSILDSEYDNIKDITQETTDTQELLSITDTLITDYSGICTDYAITQKPIIFYWHDIDQYIKECREFYYEIQEIIPGPFAKNEEELLNLILNRDWFETHDHQHKYQKFIDQFHQYRDASSTERACQQIIRIINSND
jgi:CDP-glycerol glycerophosphotransferase (TagB/SpsB family)